MPREVRYRKDSSDEEIEVEKNIIAESVSDGQDPSENESNQKKAEGDNDDDEDDDEETYEIERIIWHKMGKLIPGQMAFFVKWKGYPESDNSWVNAEDCNAEELIANYWASNGQPRRTGGASSSRKRAPKRMKSMDSDVKMDEDEEEQQPSKKVKRETKETKERPPSKSSKGRSRSDIKTGKSKLRSVNETTDEELEGGGNALDLYDESNPQGKYTSMEEYWGEKDWTNLIQEVLTVDYSNDDTNTVVYFLQLKNGELKATTSEYMVERAPSIAIRFFENNLRFRA